MSDFKKLKVWQKAHKLELAVYRIAGDIRGSLNMSLRSQMVRAAQSISANIVEGRGQPTDRAFARYLGISLNSSSELEHHLITAKALGLIANADYLRLLGMVIEVRRMLIGLIETLEQ